jgi:AcrR family transcriptional regulator
MRQRVLDVAERLVQTRGLETITLDEITDAADIARRSFYNLFQSKHDLLVPVAQAHMKSLNRRIDSLTEGISDPAEVVSVAFRHTLRGLLEDPLCRWLIRHSGLPVDRLREAFQESGVRDLDRGVRQGRFALPNPRAAEDLIGGAAVAVVSERASAARTDADLDDTVEYVLRLLGLPPDEAQEIAHRPLPSLPDAQGQDSDHNKMSAAKPMTAQKSNRGEAR